MEANAIENMAFSVHANAIENIDEFIFETVRPFCEEKMQQRISKEVLTRALKEYFSRHKIESDKLIVTFDSEGDSACLIVGRPKINEDGKEILDVKKIFTDNEAIELYKKLIGEER